MVTNVCAKSNYDRLHIDKALGIRKSDNRNNKENNKSKNKKLSYCWETVPRDSMPRIAEMDVEMTA